LPASMARRSSGSNLSGLDAVVEALIGMPRFSLD